MRGESRVGRGGENSRCCRREQRHICMLWSGLRIMVGSKGALPFDTSHVTQKSVSEAYLGSSNGKTSQEHGNRAARFYFFSYNHRSASW